MKKNILLFVAMFAVGSVAALAYRTARHQPHAGHTPTQAPAHTPAQTPAPPHDHSASAAPEQAKTTVNSVCPICGMDVDPSLKPAEYKGKLVGFGCRACPPKFARDPERYGPSALQNKTVEN